VRVVGSNRSGLEAAARAAKRLGVLPILDVPRLEGEASRAGRRLARRASTMAAGSVLLAGGETTVTLGRARGRGGRSLELALSAAMELGPDGSLALLAAGSDGLDGSSGAAGAFADGSTVSRALARGRDPARALAAHETRRFFWLLSDLLITGPTGTNVGDWVFLIRRGRRGRAPRSVKPL
jgi:glycerate-2-kinase